MKSQGRSGSAVHRFTAIGLIAVFLLSMEGAVTAATSSDTENDEGILETCQPHDHGTPDESNPEPEYGPTSNTTDTHASAAESEAPTDGNSTADADSPEATAEPTPQNETTTESPDEANQTARTESGNESQAGNETAGTNDTQASSAESDDGTTDAESNESYSDQQGNETTTAQTVSSEPEGTSNHTHDGECMSETTTSNTSNETNQTAPMTDEEKILRLGEQFIFAIRDQQTLSMQTGTSASIVVDVCAAFHSLAGSQGIEFSGTGAVPASCPPPPLPDAQPCPNGDVGVDDTCIDPGIAYNFLPDTCPSGYIGIGNTCIEPNDALSLVPDPCPNGDVGVDSTCIDPDMAYNFLPDTCPSGYIGIGNTCIQPDDVLSLVPDPCPSGYIGVENVCIDPDVAYTLIPDPCPDGDVGIDGICVDPDPSAIIPSFTNCPTGEAGGVVYDRVTGTVVDVCVEQNQDLPAMMSCPPGATGRSVYDPNTGQSWAACVTATPCPAPLVGLYLATAETGTLLNSGCIDPLNGGGGAADLIVATVIGTGEIVLGLVPTPGGSCDGAYIGERAEWNVVAYRILGCLMEVALGPPDCSGGYCRSPAERLERMLYVDSPEMAYTVDGEMDEASPDYPVAEEETPGAPVDTYNSGNLGKPSAMVETDRCADLTGVGGESARSCVVIFINGYAGASETSSMSYDGWTDAKRFFEDAGYIVDRVAIYGGECFSDHTTITRGQHAGWAGNEGNGHVEDYHVGCDGSSLLVHDKGTALEHLAYHFAWYVYERYTRHGEPVDVVAYSMGGLIARYALARAQDWNNDGNWPPMDVEDVITWGTPHAGTDNSFYGTTCGGTDYQMVQMCKYSGFIRWLRDHGQAPSGIHGTDWSLIGSYNDQWVTASSSRAMQRSTFYTYISPEYTHYEYHRDDSYRSDADVYWGTTASTNHESMRDPTMYRTQKGEHAVYRALISSVVREYVHPGTGEV